MAKKIKEYYASVESDENGMFLSIPIMSKGKEYKILIDTVDYERFKRYNWSVLYRRGEARYLKRRILKAERKEGKEGVELLHHFVIGLGGEIHLDHIDGNGFNCRSCNIRAATPTQNAQNSKSRKNTSSKYKGVGWCKGGRKWMARIRYQGKLHQIGRYKKEIINGIDEGEKRAARKYDEQAILLFGSFARLNFPEERNIVTIKSEKYKRVYLLNHIETEKIEEKIREIQHRPYAEVQRIISGMEVNELLDFCHYYGCGVNQLAEQVKQGILSKRA